MKAFIKKVLLLTVVYLSFVSLTVAQTKNVTKKDKQWLQYYNTIKLNNSWIIKSDGGFRWENRFENNSQYIIRTGLAYKIMPKMQVLLGIAHLGFYNNDELSRREIRPYQEFTINDLYGKLKIQHRYRLEERYFSTINSSATSFNYRFRYRIYVTFPIVDFSEEEKSSKLFLNLGDEIFINAGKDIVYNIFNQNRVLLGTTYQLNKNFSFTFTYNFEFGARNQPQEFTQNNIFWLGIAHKINAVQTKRK